MGCMQSDLFSSLPLPEATPIVLVAVARPLASALSYAWPFDQAPRPGCRVLVPLGNKVIVGILFGVENNSEAKDQLSSKPNSGFQLKPVKELLDNAPLLDSSLLKQAQFISQYYHQPIGEVLFTLLPSSLRKGESASPSLVRYWALCSAEKIKLRGQRQQALWQRLNEQPDKQLPVSELRLQGFNRSHFQGLQNKGLAEERLLPVSYAANNKAPSPALQLNAEQQQVLQAVKHDGFNCHLIFGITGSGKTELYLQSIEQALARGKQCLLLVPEIGLTPQLLSRFQQRFTLPIALLHSGLSDQERLNQWLLAANGQARIIIGTRSALFVPAPELGLIIIDEEHDPSFKQQDGIRYQARDLAVKRAADLGLPILLGSATPSLESLHNAYQGRYQLHYLRQRANDAQPPFIDMVDMRQHQGSQALADKTLKRMQEHLQQGNQVLVFLNRRGYAPSLLCSQCGWLADCPNCDARLVVHQQPERLQCHHCGWQHPVPSCCPSCGSHELHALGHGTVRLESQLQQHWPQLPLVRIDRDSTQGKQLAEQLAQIPEDQPGIFVGTQMLAKGHHLPSITLVVVVDGDAGFQGPDFRNLERMAQQLLQVAGRAGRGDRLGEVLIQSRYPEHGFFQVLRQQGYEQLAKQWLSERQSQQLPPFAAMATLRADHEQGEQALAQLQQAKQQLLAQGFNGRLLGPVPAPMSKRQGMHRYLIYLYCSQRAQLQQQLQLFHQWLYQSSLAGRLSIGLDVDPYDLG